MRLRLLITLGLVLFLSTFASSNECRRYCGPTASGSSEAAGVDIQPSSTPAAQNCGGNGEYSTLLVNKLLYI